MVRLPSQVSPEEARGGAEDEEPVIRSATTYVISAVLTPEHEEELSASTVSVHPPENKSKNVNNKTYAVR